MLKINKTLTGSIVLLMVLVFSVFYLGACQKPVEAKISALDVCLKDCDIGMKECIGDQDFDFVECLIQWQVCIEGCIQ